VNRYPVFMSDIRPLGLRFIEIDGAITDQTVSDVRAMLASPRRRGAIARRNFEIARNLLGYPYLRRRLARLISDLGAIERPPVESQPI
jgi:hypothetical protein